MFPTFDVPPQQAETIKARKARKGKEDAASQSSASIRSEKTGSSASKQSNGFGWFSKSKKNEIKEIPVAPSLKKTQSNIQDAPLPPPTKALPSPPTGAVSPGLLSPGLLSPASTTGSFNGDPRRRTQASAFSHSSGSSSAPSVFSRLSLADTVFTEDSFTSHADTNNSPQVDTNNRVVPGPFARALTKMEAAGPRVMAARLGEEWDGLDDDESYQEVAFEKRLWALTAYHRLTQNKQLQSPAHELLFNSRPTDQRRILNLYGSLADGWMLATCYSGANVYTVSCTQNLNAPTMYPAPLNHHPLFIPSVSSPLPFPDGYFDAIISRSVSTVLANDEWAPCFFDSMRVLKPGGQLEILSLDAHISREGPKLSAWVDQYTTGRLEAQGLSMQPSDTVLDTMDIVGLENIRRARIALPAHAAALGSTRDAIDTGRMMMLLGRHFYQDIYGRLLDVKQGEEWFWERKDTRAECDRQQAKMVLTVTCSRKARMSPDRQSSFSA